MIFHKFVDHLFEEKKKAKNAMIFINLFYKFLVIHAIIIRYNNEIHSFLLSVILLKKFLSPSKKKLKLLRQNRI